MWPIVIIIFHKQSKSYSQSQTRRCRTSNLEPAYIFLLANDTKKYLTRKCLLHLPSLPVFVRMLELLSTMYDDFALPYYLFYNRLLLRLQIHRTSYCQHVSILIRYFVEQKKKVCIFDQNSSMYCILNQILRRRTLLNSLHLMNLNLCVKSYDKVLFR